MKNTLMCLSALALTVVARGGLVNKLEATGDALTHDFSNIRLILFTNSSNSSYPIANAADLPANPLFDKAKPTVIYAHGWRSNNVTEGVVIVTKAFLQRDSHNFVLVDWGDYIGGDIITSSLQVPGAGEAVGKAINEMVAAGMAQDSLWIIGHSLGGRLAAVVVQYLPFKPARITGLDPAAPGAGAPGLTREDAVLVDVIHTDAGWAGSAASDATIDFWPNNGRRPQSGCTSAENDISDPAFLSGCSHAKSWFYLAASVVDETLFPAVSCRSWLDFQAGSCAPGDDNVVYMGYAADATNVTGSFYLRTGANEPYGLGLDGARPSI